MRLSLQETFKYNNKAVHKNNFDAHDVSFGHLPEKVMISVSKAMDKSPILSRYSEKFDKVSSMKQVRRYIGSSADTLLKHIKDDKIISANIVSDKDTIQFRNKRPVRLLIDGLLYPVAKIPFYILYGFTNFLKKFNFTKNAKWMEKFEKSSFYKITHSYLKKDDKLNALQGLMELGNRKNVMGSKNRAKSFLQNTAKTFDSKCGNYNSVNERALTRIVTGFIPAFFLANDAHNLSILCNNNKKEADQEKKLRFKQETARVLSNAYIQLITLGALSKFINKSKAWYVSVTIGTVLLTEAYSRLRIGKKIHFISPEEAREMNRKMQEKSGLTFVLDRTTNSMKVGINGVDNFKNNPKFNKFKDLDKLEAKKENDEKIRSKSIMSLGTLGKIVVGITLAGFALKGIKKIPVGKGKIGDFFDNISKWFGKIYSSITMKSNHIKKEEIDKVFDKMNKNGFSEIAKSYRKVLIDHHKHFLYPKYVRERILKHADMLGDKDWQNLLRDFASGDKESKFIKQLKDNKLAYNLKLFKRYLSAQKKTDLIKSVEELTKNTTPEKAYPKLHKLFGKTENEEFREIFENLYVLDQHSLKNEFLVDLKRRMAKANLSKTWNAIERNVLSDIKGMTYYDLGKSKIPIVKDAVDFCIEPFKFVWNFLTLSYRYPNKILSSLTPVPRKPISDMSVVSSALSSLRKKTTMPDAAFKHMFDEKIVKGFNNATMSKLANSDLSSLAKSASTVATMSFLVADNYNMVMLKSNGKDKEEAGAKGKERFVQEVSRFFWQQLFINLFNNTFSHTYNASLLGASAVNTASTTIGEICTRKAVGLPIRSASKQEIQDLEHNNMAGDGLKSKFFRFMSKLTGKQILSDRKMIKEKIEKNKLK